MRATGEDGPARRGAGGSSPWRAAGLALGCLAAVAATAVVFLSDDPTILRIAVVSVAWACLLAAFATARPADDDGAAARSEADLRAAHRREVAEVRDAERERTDRVRRDSEDAMRRELDALRGELAGLREGLSGLGALRQEVAAVGALSGELRGELAELTGLRADVGRLRAELTGQLSGEMRVERVVMHAQSVRTGPGREALEPATSAWSADVARELTGAWPAAPAPATVAAPASRPEPRPEPVAAPVPSPVAARSRPAVPVPPPARPAAGSPREWLAARGMLDDRPAVPPAAVPPVPLPAAAERVPHRRRTDPPAPAHRAPAPSEQVTVQRPAVHATAAGHGATAAPGVPPVVAPALAPAPSPAPAPVAVVTGGDDPGAARLAQILAESGVRPGGRRRRYREDDAGEDVLARVLGR
ncbi:DUF6779 domain-containing protein [Geodermatophilus sp. FMUSA9-8]|uniref:DUF6779 domain-containing protein n=1 Tax=Geodermatophilus sp. FMUSA9-8 TaxID=3120155 RepID=UPI0030092763